MQDYTFADGRQQRWCSYYCLEIFWSSSPLANVIIYDTPSLWMILSRS